MSVEAASLPNIHGWIHNALRHTSALSACVFDLIAWLEVAQHISDVWTQSTAGRKTMHAIYDICFAWAIAPRAEHQIQELLLLGCRCGAEDWLVDTHRAGLGSFQAAKLAKSPFSHLLATMLCPCIAYFTEHDDHKRISCRLMHTFNPRLWPCSAKSLLPHGGEVTLHALVRLLRPGISFVVQERVYIALHLVFACCRPIVFPFFVASPSFMRAASVPIEHVDPQMDPAPQEGLGEYRATCAVVCGMLQVCSRLMSELVGVNFTEAQRRIFRQNSAYRLNAAYSAAYHSMSKAAELIPDFRPEGADGAPCSELAGDITAQLASLGGRLYHDCAELGRSSEIPAEISERCRQEARAFAKSNSVRPWLHLIELMHHLETRQR